MKNRIFELFNALKGNSNNHIIFYKGNKRQLKTFKDLSEDIDLYAAKIKAIPKEVKKVALIGPATYEWMVLDLACIKAGILTIAIPENLSLPDIQLILKENSQDLILCDSSFYKNRDSFLSFDYYFFRSDTEISDEVNFDIISPDTSVNTPENLILEVYSIAFSSGTSGKIKQFYLSFNPITKPEGILARISAQLKKIKLVINWKLSFWSRTDNRLIVYMPFSHWQQRSFIIQALAMKINIVLSDPKNCVKHIILEKPNIMVSVPVIYEVLAENIKKKLASLKGNKKSMFKLYNKLKINTFSDSNSLKKVFSNYLFSDIKKIYGGRADYFITGSAPIKEETLRVFYSVGVKIIEAYGQSEVGIIAMNSPQRFKIGSVGKPVLNVKIGADSEILVKYEEEKHKHKKPVLTINEEGFIKTGDAGYLDKNGFLYIKGRLDDVLVFKNGKKIFPEELSDKLCALESIKQAVVFNKQDKLAVVLTLRNDLKQKQIPAMLNELNEKLPDYSRINSYLVVPEFTSENSFLTATLKVRSRKVIEAYREKEFYKV